MFRNTVFGLLFPLIINFFYYSVSANHWMYSRYSRLAVNDGAVYRQPRIVNNESGISNETDFRQKLLENNVTSTTEKDILFWTMPETKEFVEADVGSQMDVKLDDKVDNIFGDKEENKLDEVDEKLDAELEIVNNTLPGLEETAEVEINETISHSTSPPEQMQSDSKPEENQSSYGITYNDLSGSIMDERIVLQRNNCHLEIAVQETHDLKMEIMFGKLQNNISGKCTISLNGQENTMLGVFISNIYLYQNGSHGEVLKVITMDYGSDFVLKEYYSRTTYEPLLLTETHRVYIVLYYKVGSVPANQQNSHFNLELFSYHKYANYIHQGSSYTESHVSYQNGVQKPPVKDMSFAPYYYYYF